MKALFENKSIEFQVSGSQVEFAINNEVIKVMDVDSNAYGVYEFKELVGNVFGTMGVKFEN